jgi:hypothetical protein
MCSYATKNFKKLKQLVYKTIFNASYLFFMQNSYRRMFISNYLLYNLLKGIIRSNYINLFHEIMCHYEAINVKNHKQLV